MKFEDITNKAKKIVDANSKANNKNVETTIMHQMHEAIEKLDKPLALQLIEKGFDVDVRDTSGNTLLQFMITEGCSIEIVSLLLELGFEVNSVNNRSWTALFLVRKYLKPNEENREIHKLLVENGAIAKPNRYEELWM